MRYSKIGLQQLTERFELCRLAAYRDVRGVWTIGWGHTGPEVVEGLVWSQQQADVALIDDTNIAESTVNHLTQPGLTQGEFDALVDFCFNVGSGNFAHSTMLRLLNAGNYSGAANEFEKWDYAGGKQVAGLLRRRVAEKESFQK